MARKISNSGRTIEVSSRLAALKEVLRGFPGLVAAYLYGSYGTPLQTPLSDVDIAVLFAKDEVPSSRRHLELIGLIVDALREEDVSVTLLNRRRRFRFATRCWPKDDSSSCSTRSPMRTSSNAL
jgi:predicted nucleotidyltransferase